MVTTTPSKPPPKTNPIIERALKEGSQSGGTIGNVTGGLGGGTVKKEGGSSQSSGQTQIIYNEETKQGAVVPADNPELNKQIEAAKQQALQERQQKEIQSAANRYIAQTFKTVESKSGVKQNIQAYAPTTIQGSSLEGSPTVDYKARVSEKNYAVVRGGESDTAKFDEKFFKNIPEKKDKQTIANLDKNISFISEETGYIAPSDIKQNIPFRNDLNPVSDYGGYSNTKYQDLPHVFETTRMTALQILTIPENLVSKGFGVTGGVIQKAYEEQEKSSRLLFGDKITNKYYKPIKKVSEDVTDVGLRIVEGTAGIATYFLPFGMVRFGTQVVLTGGSNLYAPIGDTIKDAKDISLASNSRSAYESFSNIVVRAATFGFAGKVGKEYIQRKTGSETENIEKIPTIKTWFPAKIEETSVPTPKEMFGLQFNLNLKNVATKAEGEAARLGLVTNLKVVDYVKTTGIDTTPVVSQVVLQKLQYPEIQKFLIPVKKSEGAFSGSGAEQSYARGESSVKVIGDIDVIAPLSNVKGKITISEGVTDTGLYAITRLAGKNEIENVAINWKKLEDIDKSVYNYQFKEDILKGLSQDKRIILEEKLKTGADIKGSTKDILIDLATVRLGKKSVSEFNKQYEKKAEIDDKGVFSFKEISDVDVTLYDVTKANVVALNIFKRLEKETGEKYTLSQTVYGKKGNKVTVLEYDTVGVEQLAPIYSKFETLTFTDFNPKPSVARKIFDIDESGKKETLGEINVARIKDAESITLFSIKKEGVTGPEAKISDIVVPTKFIEFFSREGTLDIGGKLRSAFEAIPVSLKTKDFEAKFSLQSSVRTKQDQIDIMSQAQPKGLKQAKKVAEADVLNIGETVKFNVPSEKYIAVVKGAVLDKIGQQFDLAENRIREISTSAEKGNYQIILQDQKNIGVVGNEIKLGQVLNPNFQMSAKNVFVRGYAPKSIRELNTAEGKISYAGDSSKIDVEGFNVPFVSYKQLLDQSVLRDVAGRGKVDKSQGRFDIIESFIKRGRERRESGQLSKSEAKKSLKLEKQILRDLQMEKGEIPNTRKVYFIESFLSRFTPQSLTYYRELLFDKGEAKLSNKQSKELSVVGKKETASDSKDIIKFDKTQEAEFDIMLRNKVYEANIIEQNKQIGVSILKGSSAISKSYNDKASLVLKNVDVKQEVQNTYKSSSDYGYNYPKTYKSSYVYKNYNYTSKPYSYSHVDKSTPYPITNKTPYVSTPSKYNIVNIPTKTTYQETPYPEIVKIPYKYTPTKYPTKIPETYTPVTTIPKTPPVFYGKERPKKESKIRKFFAQQRRRGKFENIGFSESPEQAFDIGRTKTERNLGASFRVIGEQGEVITDFKKALPSSFYRSAREQGVFIQERSNRLGSIGEKREIQIAKKSKNIFTGGKSKSIFA